MGRVCPRCGRAVRAGERHACHLAPKGGRRDTDKEAARREGEAWRKRYDGEFRRIRSLLVAECEGRCEVCGSVVYRRTTRGWRKVARDFGGVHHLVPLSKGGRNSKGNAALLCARCHGAAHSAAYEAETAPLGYNPAKASRLAVLRGLVASQAH